MDPLPNRYDPKVAEPKWQKHWEEERAYVHEPTPESITIDTPPPTVSGNMHIGHAYSYAQQDFYARFWRMRTGKVFFPFGTDDNGLPTERLVEKIKGVKGTRMERGAFRKLCFDTVQEIKPDFVADWKSIGMSCDFESTYSTIDPRAITTSQRSFIDLHKKGRVYRMETPAAWCVQCQTAIAQAEFDNVELSSAFNDIQFHIDAHAVTIATTRPELIPACVAIAAHPEDPRYAPYHGKRVTVPLFGYDVPLILDENVDREKGTGLMMVCTFGDKEDIDKWFRHKLDMRVIFARDGKLNDLAGKYAGLSIKDARKAIIEDLKAGGFLIGQKPITHPVNVHERCGTEVEFLKTPQWYIRVLDIKQELVDAGAMVRWHPEFMFVRYKHWVENLNWDWCVSRQRHFGVPFPVWYDKRDGTVYVADESQLPVDPLTQKPTGVSEDVLAHLVPEMDVMDTWATSSVTPQIILGWNEDQQRAESLLPMTIRPQAHEIIRTWAFYTITKSWLHHRKAPWSDIVLSGYVTDPHGQKMSKSKGNVVEPRSVIAKHCADAVRSWAASVKLGEDIPYMEKELVAGMKTINKLWNASRFVLMNLEGYDGWTGRFEDLEVMDRWLLGRYAKLITRCTEAFEAYDHSKAKSELEQFFWTDLCDNYLEIVKGRLYDPKDALQKRSAQFTLSTVLGGVLKLFAPILPFVTEEIYQLHFAAQDGAQSIHLARWPAANDAWADKDAAMIGDEVVRIVAAVRKYKTDKQFSMAAPLAQLTVTTQHDLTLAQGDLLSATRAQSFAHVKGEFDVKVE